MDEDSEVLEALSSLPGSPTVIEEDEEENVDDNDEALSAHNRHHYADTIDVLDWRQIFYLTFLIIVAYFVISVIPIENFAFQYIPSLANVVYGHVFVKGLVFGLVVMVLLKTQI